METTDSNREQLQVGAVGAALEREHREIDAGIDAFRTSSTGGEAGSKDAVLSLRRAADALRRHIYLEEEFLFPSLRRDFAIPIGVMLREHGEIWRTLDVLEQKLETSDGHDSVLRVCEELTVQLDRHNSKEEPIFYTQADRALGTEQIAELHDFLRSGQMPEGWACYGTRA